MLPAPIWPLAEHAEFGQNCFDASIGSAVFVCICTSCRWIPPFSSFPPQFHRLVGLYLMGDESQKKPSILSLITKIINAPLVILLLGALIAGKIVIQITGFQFSIGITLLVT